MSVFLMIEAQEQRDYWKRRALAAEASARSQSERERRLEEALKDLVAFVSVMCGSGEEAVIPETVATPLGVQVKIGAMMRDARSALNQEGWSNVG